MDAVERYNLWCKVIDLLSDCTDVEVLEWFDVDSEKMLKKKERVLTALNAGKSPDEIGDDYYKILEKKPKEM